jgi:hypothetical protein
MELRLISWPEAEGAWMTFQGRQSRPLVQHSSNWQKMLASIDLWEWRSLALCEGGEIVAALPFCERRTDLGAVAMSSPTPAAYAGVLHIEDADRGEVYRRLLSAFVEYGSQEKIDVLSIFSSPFRDDYTLYRSYLLPNYTLEKFYQYLPGDIDLQTVGNAHFRSNLRRLLRRADQSGFLLQETIAPPRALISQWHKEILSPRLESIGARPAGLDLFLSMSDAFSGNSRFRFISVTHEDKMVAGGIFLFGWCEDIYLRAAQTEAQRQGAAILMDYEMIRRGIAQSTHAINFQSSPSREHPVYDYKKQWGTLEGNTYYMVRLLAKPEKFLKAGKRAVLRSFPYFFILPFSAYEESQ